MAVIPWWRGRLLARQPIGEPALWVEGITYKPSTDGGSWPKCVGKQALYKDYLSWFDDVYLEPYRGVGLYTDNPHLMPTPARDLDFFVTLAPFLYILNRVQQTRAYKIPIKVRYQDGYVTIRTRQNFVRLCAWEAHAAQFALQTGIQVLDPLIPFGIIEAKVEIVAQAAYEQDTAIRENRERVPGRVKGVDAVEDA
jgi:hypothetical protein